MSTTIEEALRTAMEWGVCHDFLERRTGTRLGQVAAAAGRTAANTVLGDVVDTLADCVVCAVSWVCDLDGCRDDDAAGMRVLGEVAGEWRRADAKHQGRTPASPAMSDDDRAAILLEEVGEVARALTPDAGTEVGHGGDLREELVQVAAMGAAWLMHCMDTTAVEVA